MSLEQIHTVLAVAETGSLRRAAERLHTTQPPLTRRLASLEDELGTLLFHRNAKGMLLSDAGVRFMPHARRILSAIEDAREACLSQHPASSDRQAGQRSGADPALPAQQPRGTVPEAGGLFMGLTPSAE